MGIRRSGRGYKLTGADAVAFVNLVGGTRHPNENATRPYTTTAGERRCLDCGVQLIENARHFSGCRSNAGEPAVRVSPPTGLKP